MLGCALRLSVWSLLLGRERLLLLDCSRRGLPGLRCGVSCGSWDAGARCSVRCGMSAAVKDMRCMLRPKYADRGCEAAIIALTLLPLLFMYILMLCLGAAHGVLSAASSAAVVTAVVAKQSTNY